ncbi:MAG: universal stress protein [Solirubrobacteraceae bacterium]
MTTPGKDFTIVVGYDGSDAARRGLARARHLGVEASTILVVAVAADVRSGGLGLELSAQPFDAERILDDAREWLGERQGVTVETRAEAGDPAVVLVDIARHVGAGLIILGRRGGDFVARTLLGSVAQRVVQHAPCDVLVVA